jgi:FKBP-type peptidyl-prolyl cis-trans isomerase
VSLLPLVPFLDHLRERTLALEGKTSNLCKRVLEEALSRTLQSIGIYSATEENLIQHKFIPLLTVFAVLAMTSGCSDTKKSSAPSTSSPTKVNGPPKTTASGLQYWDIVVGTGATAGAGNPVTVHYTGWLASGEKFDSSVDRGQPFSFPLGAGQVIKGWDEGVAGMKVGGKRQLRIPPELGYGARGAGGVIPPNATLIFDVELLEVNK